MAYLITCHNCGKAYPRNPGPQDTHICKTIEQRAYEQSEATKRALDAAEQADLPNKVRRLEAALAAYRWIPVGERLPTVPKKYAVVIKGSKQFSTRWYWQDGKKGWGTSCNITHWREIDLPGDE